MNELIKTELNFVNSARISAGVTDYVPLEPDDHNEINGGVLTDTRFSWVSCGPRLTIINNNDGSIRNGWTFGRVQRDSTTKITCIAELPVQNTANPILVVGCESAISGGTVCFYHTGSARVLKAIHFNEKVTSLAVVHGSDEPNPHLVRFVGGWSGVVAVGTKHGAVYLIDLWRNGLDKCISDYHFRTYDELHVSQLSLVTLEQIDPGLDYRKHNKIRHGGSTPGIFLNDGVLMKQGSNENKHRLKSSCILSRVSRDQLVVTAIQFFPKICTLAVGFNISCFQLWDLSDLTLLYTSALMEAKLPVCRFALLEPSDDPRYVCFLWSLHQSSGQQQSLPFGAMYLLNYDSKQNVTDFGNLYQDFSNCSLRYELDFGDEIPSVEDGRIISCRTINKIIKKTIPYSLKDEDASVEESCLSLVTITWEVWSQNRAQVSNCITVFDLNQWYQEHMPSSTITEYDGYLTHLTLKDYEEDVLLDVRLREESLKPYVAFYHFDQHYYPSSLSFECVCLYRLNIVHGSRTGVQRACLNAIENGGASALLNPTPLFKLCDLAGVKPLLADVHVSHLNNMSVKDQRELVLSVALENGMNGFLWSCVQEWSDGSQAVAGSTLPSLLSWAWSRVALYKLTADKLCVPLFNYSGVKLDFNDRLTLEHCVRQLHNLSNLFRMVLDKFRSFILQDNLEQQCTALGLVSLYLDAVLWFLRSGVLPESLDGEVASLYGNNQVPYLVNRITGATKARRVELEHIASNLKNKAPPSGLFFIDALIEQECGGSRLTDQWELEGGATTMGKYPPPSVQSLLRIYLIRGIPKLYKHYVVLYFILDVINHLDSKRYSEHIERLLMFPTMFGLTESQSRIVQAFWDLDHKHFEEAIEHLLHANVSKQDLQCYQHRAILRLLVAEGKHKLSLRYLNLKKPPLSDDEDIKFEMGLLLSNGLAHEAFSFQRQHKSLQKELLYQFFSKCVEMKKIDVVYKLPLNLDEEVAFTTFLELSQHPKGDDLSVYYLVTRARYLEAIDLHNKLRAVSASRRRLSKPPPGLTPVGPRGFNIFGTKDNLASGTPNESVLTTRDLIINAISKTLPSITRELAEHCAKEKPVFTASKLVQRPTPLSVVVHTEISKDRLPHYKTSSSKMMEAALAKTRETWAPLLVTPTAIKSRLKSNVDEIPFLRTPSGHHRYNPAVLNHTLSPVREGTAKRLRQDDSDHPSKKSRIDLATAETSKHDFSCSDSLLLVNTPHVPRAVTSLIKAVLTPQSILKTQNRKPVQTTTSTIFSTPEIRDDDDNISVKSTPSGRQIRFSLPNDESSSSPSCEETDVSPNVTPRKPLYSNLRSLAHSRDLTPANPRLARNSLRHSYLNTSFESEVPQSSADASKASSSPVTSDDVFFSLESSLSSKNTEKGSNSSKDLSSVRGKIICNLSFEDDEANVVDEENDFEVEPTEGMNTTVMSEYSYDKKSTYKIRNTLSSLETKTSDISSDESETENVDNNETLKAPPSPLVHETVSKRNLDEENEYSDEDEYSEEPNTHTESFISKKQNVSVTGNSKLQSRLTPRSTYETRSFTLNRSLKMKDNVETAEEDKEYEMVSEDSESLISEDQSFETKDEPSTNHFHKTLQLSASGNQRSQSYTVTDINKSVETDNVDETGVKTSDEKVDEELQNIPTDNDSLNLESFEDANKKDDLQTAQDTPLHIPIYDKFIFGDPNRSINIVTKDNQSLIEVTQDDSEKQFKSPGDSTAIIETKNNEFSNDKVEEISNIEDSNYDDSVEEEEEIQNELVAAKEDTAFYKKKSLCMLSTSLPASVTYKDILYGVESRKVDEKQEYKTPFSSTPNKFSQEIFQKSSNEMVEAHCSDRRLSKSPKEIIAEPLDEVNTDIEECDMSLRLDESILDTSCNEISGNIIQEQNKIFEDKSLVSKLEINRITDTIHTSKEVDLEPVNTAQEIDLEPVNINQEVDLEPVNTAQKVDLEPVNTAKEVDLEPVNINQEVDLEPVNTAKEVNLEPVNINQEVDLEPVNTAQEVDLEPVNTAQEVDLEPVNTAKEVDLEPVNINQEVDLEPVNIAQEIDLEPVNTAQEVDLKPENTAQEVDLEPVNTAQEVDLESVNINREVDLEPLDIFASESCEKAESVDNQVPTEVQHLSSTSDEIKLSQDSSDENDKVCIIQSAYTVEDGIENVCSSEVFSTQESGEEKTYQSLKPVYEETEEILEPEENFQTEDDYYDEEDAYEEEEQVENDEYNQEDAGSKITEEEETNQSRSSDIICLDSDSDGQTAPPQKTKTNLQKKKIEEYDELYGGLDDELDYDTYSNSDKSRGYDVDDYVEEEEEYAEECEEVVAEEDEDYSETGSSSSESTLGESLIETPNKRERSWKGERRGEESDEELSERSDVSDSGKSYHGSEKSVVSDRSNEEISVVSDKEYNNICDTSEKGGELISIEASEIMESGEECVEILSEDNQMEEIMQEVSEILEEVGISSSVNNKGNELLDKVVVKDKDDEVKNQENKIEEVSEAVQIVKTVDNEVNKYIVEINVSDKEHEAVVTEENQLVEQTPEEPVEEKQLVEQTPEEPVEEKQLMEQMPEEPVEEKQLMEQTPEEPVEEKQLVEQTPEETVEEKQLVEQTPEEPVEEKQMMEQMPKEPVEEKQLVEQTTEEPVEEKQLVEQMPEEPVEEKQLVEQMPEESVEEKQLMEQTPEEPVEEKQLVEQMPEEPVEEKQLVEQMPEESVEEKQLMEQTPEEPVEEKQLVEQTPKETVEEKQLVEQTPEEPVEEKQMMEQMPKEPVEEKQLVEQTTEEPVEEKQLVEQMPEEPVEEKQLVEQMPEESVEEKQLMEQTPEEPVEEKQLVEQMPEEPVEEQISEVVNKLFVGMKGTEHKEVAIEEKHLEEQMHEEILVEKHTSKTVVIEGNKFDREVIEELTKKDPITNTAHDKRSELLGEIMDVDNVKKQENKEKIRQKDLEEIERISRPSTSRGVQGLASDVMSKHMRIVKLFFQNMDSLKTNVDPISPLSVVPNTEDLSDKTITGNQVGVSSLLKTVDEIEYNGNKDLLKEVEGPKNENVMEECIDEATTQTSKDSTIKKPTVAVVEEQISDKEVISVSDKDQEHVVETEKTTDTVLKQPILEKEIFSQNENTTEMATLEDSKIKGSSPKLKPLQSPIDMVTLREKVRGKHVETGSLSELKRRSLRRRSYSDSQSSNRSNKKMNFKVGRKSISVTSIPEETTGTSSLEKIAPSCRLQDDLKTKTEELIQNEDTVIEPLNFSGVDVLPNLTEVNLDTMNKTRRRSSTSSLQSRTSEKESLSEVNSITVEVGSSISDVNSINKALSQIEPNLNLDQLKPLQQYNIQMRTRSLATRRLSSLSNIKEIPELTPDNQVSLFRSASTSDVNVGHEENLSKPSKRRSSSVTTWLEFKKGEESARNMLTTASSGSSTSSQLDNVFEDPEAKLNRLKNRLRNYKRVSLINYRQSLPRRSSVSKQDSLEVVTSSDEDEVTVKKKLRRVKSVESLQQPADSIDSVVSIAGSNLNPSEDRLSTEIIENVSEFDEKPIEKAARSKSVPPQTLPEMIEDENLNNKILRTRRAASEEIRRRPNLRIISKGKHTKNWIKRQQLYLEMPIKLRRSSVMKQNFEPLEVVESEEEYITVGPSASNSDRFKSEDTEKGSDIMDEPTSTVQFSQKERAEQPDSETEVLEKKTKKEKATKVNKTKNTKVSTTPSKQVYKDSDKEDKSDEEMEVLDQGKDIKNHSKKSKAPNKPIKKQRSAKKLKELEEKISSESEEETKNLKKKKRSTSKSSKQLQVVDVQSSNDGSNKKFTDVSKDENQLTDGLPPSKSKKVRKTSKLPDSKKNKSPVATTDSIESSDDEPLQMLKKKDSKVLKKKANQKKNVSPETEKKEKPLEAFSVKVQSRSSPTPPKKAKLETEDASPKPKRKRGRPKKIIEVSVEQIDTEIKTQKKTAQSIGDNEAYDSDASSRTTASRTKSKSNLKLQLDMLDSPARRTRRRSSAMSEASSVDSASLRLEDDFGTPEKRVTRRRSLLETSGMVTPDTPQSSVTEEYTSQRRLPRKQLALFPHSMEHSPNLGALKRLHDSRLEDVSEESGNDDDKSVSPVSSSFNTVSSSKRNKDQLSRNVSPARSTRSSSTSRK